MDPPVRDVLVLWYVKQTDLWHVAVFAEEVIGKRKHYPSVYTYGYLKGLEFVNKCVSSALNTIACRTTFTLCYTNICFTVSIKKEQSNLTLLKD